MNFLTDLLGHWVAFLAIDGLALATRNIPTLLFGDLRALSITDNSTLLGGNVLADLILDSGALLLIDNFTFSLSTSCTLLLHNWRTLVFIPGGAFLIKFSGAFFFMNGFLDSSWHTDTLQLRDVVTLLILNRATLLPGILSSLTVLSGLGSALPSRNSLLNSSLGDLTLALLDISTCGIGNTATILLGYRLISGPWNLITHLLWNLLAYWFWSSS